MEALTQLTMLLVGLLCTLGASTAIGSDATCKKGADCVDELANQAAVADSTGFIQNSHAVARTTRTDQLVKKYSAQKDADEKVVARPAHEKVVARPAMQKLIEMNTTMNFLKALGQSTPAVNVIVNGMIRTIKEEIHPQIKAAQAAVQSAVHTMISTLSTRTTEAVDKKTVADAADKTMDDCFAKQLRVLALHETCKSEETTFRNEKDSATACNSPYLGPTKTYSLPYYLKADLTCDFSVSTCTAVRDARKNAHDTWLNGLSLVSDKTNFDTAHSSCDAATERLNGKIASCLTMWSKFEARYTQCFYTLATQHLAICMFGDSLQSKCVAKSNYDTLIQDIGGIGTSDSESDRAKEWMSVKKLECMLGKFVGGSNFDNTMVDTCTLDDAVAEADFAKNVGLIDNMTSTYASLIADANFNCAETSITFTGVKWTVPLGDASTHISTAYTMETDQSYVIDLDDNAAPFDICSVHDTALTCGSFDCGSHPKEDTTKKCRLAGGCTKADCCFTQEQCGDSVVEAGEECDDGNTDAGDECSATCTLEAAWFQGESASHTCDAVCASHGRVCTSNGEAVMKDAASSAEALQQALGSKFAAFCGSDGIIGNEPWPCQYVDDDYDTTCAATRNNPSPDVKRICFCEAP